MNVLPKLVAGIFSFLLVGLVVVGPVYLAEKLEVLETSGSGLISREDMISQLNEGNEITGYIPYFESNLTNWGKYKTSSTTYYHSYCGLNPVGSDTYDTLTYNIDGTKDYIQYSPPNHKSIKFYYQMDWGQVQNDNAREVSIFFELGGEGDVKIDSIWGMFTNADFSYSEYVVIEGYDTDEYQHSLWINFTIDTGTLNTLVSTQEGYDLEHSLFYITIGTPDLGTTGHNYFDFQIGPEYYTISEEYSYWDNQTVTIYEPYIQTITPFAVHKVSMLLGGILIFVVGWIASPWGERFDKLLPINNYVRSSADPFRKKYRNR